jgi:hypothetical protein
VNAEMLDPARLYCLLQHTAAGLPADTAAVALIAAHGHFLHQPGFRRLIAAESSIFTGEPVTTIRWHAAICALDAGQLPCSSSEQAILRVAAPLAGQDIPVALRAVLGSLDARNIALVAAAVIAANG